jgi:sulfate transport system substrate-binding protein
LNLHQPAGNLEALLDTNEWEAREILLALDRIPRSIWAYEDVARVHLSLSGTLLEMLCQPRFQKRVHGLMKCGDLLWYLQNDRIIQILGTGYYHPVLPLIPAADWEQQLPNRSLPYLSTIVFVVRKANPKNIKDWTDLVKPNMVVVTPNPKTSGNGKLSVLAAWGSVTQRGGNEEGARKFVTQLCQHTPVLDTGARGATSTFAQKGIGDVHLTWENEAHLEVQEAAGALELVYPPLSIRAEPHIALVDGNVDRKGTRAAADAYLKFLYTDEAQEIIAKHFYRPINADVLARHSATFQAIDLFPVTAVAADWDAAQSKYFAEGAIFDGIYQPVQLPRAEQ